MTHVQWTMRERLAARPLAERVAWGGVIWPLGRALLGVLFLMSGVEKLTALHAFEALLVRSGIPDGLAGALALPAALLETAGGLCIVAGFATSAASFAMITFTIIAAFVAHRFWEFEGDMALLQTAHFQKNIMIVGGLCLLYVAGGGPYSIDRRLRQRRKDRR